MDPSLLLDDDESLSFQDTGCSLPSEISAIDLDSVLQNLSEEDMYHTFLRNGGAVEELSPAQSPFQGSDQEFNPDLLSALPQIDAGEFQLLTPESPKQERNLTPQKRSTTRRTAAKAPKKPRTSPLVVIKQEPGSDTENVLETFNHKAVMVKKPDEKYRKRLVANKRSAQASRERKKILKDELEGQLAQLSVSNETMSKEITELETENKVLKREFVNLQNLVNDSTVLSKMMAKTAMMSNNNVTLLQQNIARIAALLMQRQHQQYTQLQLAPADAAATSTDDDSCNNNNNVLTNLPAPSTAASMYLMIVLYSFSQYFKHLQVDSMENQPFPISPTLVM